MWDAGSLWFEVSIVSSTLLMGNIFMGHFEERTSKLRRFVKSVILVVLFVMLSAFFGRAVASVVFGLLFIPVLYIHGIWLPKQGVNGWTGEPKSKYYEMRGWSKNIFDDSPSEKM